MINFQRNREEISKEQVKVHLENTESDTLPSPDKNDASIHLIRVPSVTVTEEETNIEPAEKKPKSRLNLKSRLPGKENDKTVKKPIKKAKELKIKMHTKSKGKTSSKKTTLLPGQKTLNHFFK